MRDNKIKIYYYYQRSTDQVLFASYQELSLPWAIKMILWWKRTKTSINLLSNKRLIIKSIQPATKKKNQYTSMNLNLGTNSIIDLRIAAYSTLY